MAKSGRVEYALPILKSVLVEDIPVGQHKHTFNNEVLDIVEDAIKKLENPDAATEFSKIKDMLVKGGHIAQTVSLYNLLYN